MIEVYAFGFMSGIVFMVWVLLKTGIIVVQTPKQRKASKDKDKGKDEQ